MKNFFLRKKTSDKVDILMAANKKYVRLLPLFFWLFFCSPIFAQEMKYPLFKNGDVVCFVGNSITQSGGFHHNILRYYVTRFPSQRVVFFNNGISGDVTGGILMRMDSDILVHHPTYAVIMIGMNDIIRSYYSQKSDTIPDILVRRRNALETYRRNLDSIIRIFISKKVKVILQKPSIYDQTAKINAENFYGVNDALKICAGYMGDFAKKYHLQTVDYWTTLHNINAIMQKKDSTATIIGADRIHPGAPGHMIMAYQFLTSTGVSKNVSKIVIYKDDNKTNISIENCQVRNKVFTDKKITFNVKEYALPFIVDDSQKKAMEFIPIYENLNMELLQVNNLLQGKYTLTIDSALIGVFSRQQLLEGINLTMYINTPQNRQSVFVNDLLNKLWLLEADLRTIKYIEYKHLPNHRDNITLPEKFAHLDSVYQKNLPKTNYLNSQINKYKVLKTQESMLIQKSDSLRLEIYRSNQPKEHVYVIEGQR